MAKRTGFSQSHMPQFALREAIDLAKSLQDNYAGQDATPIDLAKSVGRSPTSSAWRTLTSASVAYGLTTGTFSAKAIALAASGRKIVAPIEEGEDKAAILAALLQPSISRAFYEKYDGNKLPKEEIAKNVLEQMGVPKEHIDSAYSIIVENAQYAGILSNINGNLYIQLRSAQAPISRTQQNLEQEVNNATFAGNRIDAPSISPNSPSSNTTGMVIIPIIDGELGIAVSPRLQSRTWLNEKLAEKMRAITDAAREFATEWNAQYSDEDSPPAESD